MVIYQLGTTIVTIVPILNSLCHQVIQLLSSSKRFPHFSRFNKNNNVYVPFSNYYYCDKKKQIATKSIMSLGSEKHGALVPIKGNNGKPDWFVCTRSLDSS